MKSTTNYGLNKPEPTDYYDVEHFNDNFDKIDKELKVNQEHREDKENPHNVNAKHIGLEKVTNTSDEEKPVSKAQRKALEELESNVKTYTDNKVDPLSEKIDNTASVSSVVGNNPTATNSTQTPVIYLKNGGYTEQKALSGKNLLNTYDLSTSSNGVNFQTNHDKSVSVNGTNTSANVLFFPIGKITLKKDITYKLIGKYLSLRDNTYTAVYMDDGGTYTPTEDVEGTVIVRLSSGLTINETIYPMICLATVTDETYEPYVGGTASPNPDYPQHIDGLGDRGFFDGELVQGYYNGSSTIVTLANCVGSKKPIECKESDIIKLTYEEIITRTDTANSPFSISFFDANMSYLSKATTEYSTNEITATVPANAKYFLFDIRQDTAITPTTAKHICVTINGMYAVAVKTCGKNILDMSAENERNEKTQNPDHTIEYAKDGEVTYTVNSLPQAYSQAGYFYDFDTVIGRKYSVNAVFSGDCIVNVRVYKARENVDKNMITKLTSGKTFTFVATTEECMLRVWIQPTVASGTIKAIITEGEYDGNYQPYTETTANIPITAPLYDGDYIEVYADGSGQIVRKNGEYVANTSDWNVETTTSTKKRLRNNVSLTSKAKGSGANNYCNAKCNQYSAGTPNETWSGSRDNIFAIDGSGFLYIYTSKFFTLDEFKSHITDNQLKFVYELKEPTTEPLTAEQVAEFKKLQTFNEVTHITADGEVTVRYYCNTDSGDTVGMLQEMVEDHVSNKENPHGVTAKQVGLENVNNTADADKSVKYATSAGSATKASQDAKGNVISNTYATKTENTTTEGYYVAFENGEFGRTKNPNGSTAIEVLAGHENVLEGIVAYFKEMMEIDIPITTDLTVRHCKCKKQSNVVTLSLDLKLSCDCSKSTVLATLGEDARPSGAFGIYAMGLIDEDGNNLVPTLFCIGTDGTVTQNYGDDVWLERAVLHVSYVVE